MDGLPAALLLAEKGDDSNAMRHQAVSQGMRPSIPSKKNRKEPREDDADLDTLRHLIANVFLHLKRWRGIATRYAKHTASTCS